MRSPFITLVLCGLCVVVAAPRAYGNKIDLPGQTHVHLSQFASTETGPGADPADLLADVIFDLGGAATKTEVDLPTTLTITLDNRTDETNFWDIQELAFNVPDNVTAVILTAPPVGWTDSFDGGPFQVNGFGMFDVTLIDGVGGNPAQVLPGETQIFTLELFGSGSIRELDFANGNPIDPFNSFSEIDPGMGGTAMIVAAKFVNGPGDASGFGGTTIPEPSSLALLALGALAILRRRR